MTFAARHGQYALEEYLRLEEYSNVKHEYLGGQIFAMAGGTPAHGARTVRVAAALLAQLRGRRCTVYSSDVRIHVAATGLHTYPDVSVVCGRAERAPADPHAVVNPIAIVEVLSLGSAEYDRGDKLAHYKTIPSLRQIVLVSHTEPLLEVWQRDEGGDWQVRAFRAGELARLEAIDCALPVDEVYADPLDGA